MATAREIDENGYLTVYGNPISSFGVFDYSAGQLGLEGDPMRIVKVFRPESAVNNQATIDSFKNVPLIIKHAFLSGFDGDDEDGAVAPEAKGVDGILTSNVYYEAPWMRGDIKVFSRKAQNALKLGLKDLSLGYDCKFYHKPGVFNGQAYEYVQDDLIGNHIAMVPEGRVSGARVLDAKIIGAKAFVFDGEGENSGYVRVTVEEKIHNEEDMAIKDPKAAASNRRKTMDNAVQQLIGLLPALKTFLEQEATEPAHQEGGGAGAAVQTGMAGNAGEQGNGAAAAQATGENEGGDEGFGAEGGASAAAAPDLNSLITEVEACLAKLKAAAAGGSGAAQDDMNEGQPGAEAQAATTAEDSVEGLQNESHNSTIAADEANGSAVENDNNGKASAGPASGTHAKAGDASIRAFYADLAAKDSLYNGLSEVVGAFNHRAMDAREVAAYGVKKLGLKNVAEGQEISAVTLYLQGLAKGSENTAKHVRNASVGDSKDGYKAPQVGTGDAGLDAYLKSVA